VDLILSLLAALLLSSSLLMVLIDFGRRKGHTDVFTAFFLMGLSALVWPRSLWLVLPLWLYMGFTLSTLSLLRLFVSLMGLLCPLWLLTPWLILWPWESFPIPLVAGLSEGDAWFSTLFLSPSWPPVYDESLTGEAVVTACCTLWMAFCLFRYHRRRMDVRMRVRMVYEPLAFLPLLLLGWTLLVPADAWMLMSFSAFVSSLVSRLWMPSSSF
jgi:hypothetical protein